MRNKLQFLRSTFALIILLLFFGLGTAQGQDREGYVISAKAGGVNIASGDVTFTRPGATAWQHLTPGTELVARDIVKSGAYGRAEILLNPGSYLRIAENSELEFIDTSLDSLRFRINNGSAIVEVSGSDDATISIEMETPQSRIMIERRGLYRINVAQNNTELLVTKGRAIISSNTGNATLVKDGKIASVQNGQVLVAKLDQRDLDDFDLWSKQRANALVAANKQLSQRTIARNYSRYSAYGYGAGRYGYGYRSHSGLWIFNPFVGYHTFYPFYSGWYSPYGHHYSHGFGISSYRHFGSGFGIGGRHSSVGFSRHGIGRIRHRR